MKSWPIFLKLQNELAYGDTISSSTVNDVHAGIAAGYVARVRADKDLARSLVIGPGGPSEVRALEPHLVPPLHVMTAHQPELEIIRRECPHAVTELGDIHDMPYKSGVMGIVYASNVLEHAFAPYIALMECRRVLVAGGVGYFVLPEFEGRDGGRGPFHLHCLNQEVWGEMLRKTGFILADVIKVRGTEDPIGSYTHYRCIASLPPHPHLKILEELVTLKASQ
jgi:SAM-dependent methyltransferase